MLRIKLWAVKGKGNKNLKTVESVTLQHIHNSEYKETRDGLLDLKHWLVKSKIIKFIKSTLRRSQYKENLRF